MENRSRKFINLIREIINLKSIMTEVNGRGDSLKGRIFSPMLKLDILSHSPE
jgi:hypothetical protein